MDKKKRSLLKIVPGVLVFGLLLSAFLPLRGGAAQWLHSFREAPALPVMPAALSLSGVYAGQVELEYAVAGSYSDPLPAPDPGGEQLPDLGSIDLGLQLTQSESGVDGYVDLEHTLVFTTEHTVATTAFGPLVTGGFTGDSLILESERLSLVSGGQKLMRQFRLTGGYNPDNNQEIIGEYRETLWGYGTQPLTVVGRFNLVWIAPTMTDFIFMPLIPVK